MTLLELAPRWVGDVGAPATAKQGIGFSCPHCRETRLAVFFDVPICSCPPVDIAAFHEGRFDHEHLPDYHIGRVLWHREGTTFETLTLTPSIDASHFGHWHGFITRGVVQ